MKYTATCEHKPKEPFIGTVILTTLAIVLMIVITVMTAHLIDPRPYFGTERCSEDQIAFLAKPLEPWQSAMSSSYLDQVIDQCKNTSTIDWLTKLLRR